MDDLSGKCTEMRSCRRMTCDASRGYHDSEECVRRARRHVPSQEERERERDCERSHFFREWTRANKYGERNWSSSCEKAFFASSPRPRHRAHGGFQSTWLPGTDGHEPRPERYCSRPSLLGAPFAGLRVRASVPEKFPDPDGDKLTGGTVHVFHPHVCRPSLRHHGRSGGSFLGLRRDVVCMWLVLRTGVARK